jgi:alpha-L-arabinofuranosidase
MVLLAAALPSLVGQVKQGKLVIHADLGEYTVSRHIYGHFSEHLGRCIYGGYWVGRDSELKDPGQVRPVNFNPGTFRKGILETSIPAKSIVVLEIESK